MSFPNRRAAPGAVIRSQTSANVSVTLHADDEGIVKISNADQHEVAEYMQLPVVRDADAPKRKSPAKAKRPAKRPASEPTPVAPDNEVVPLTASPAGTESSTEGDEPATTEEG